MQIPAHLAIARSYIGLQEVPGPGFNARIQAMWYALPGGKWYWTEVGKGDDSKLPWCGMGAATFCREAGIPFPKNYASARAWLEWGTKIDFPTVGAFVIFERGPKQGHIGVIDGQYANGNLRVLGANQRDGVRYSAFTRDRVLGYRLPPGMAIPTIAVLPVCAGDCDVSTNEA